MCNRKKGVWGFFPLSFLKLTAIYFLLYKCSYEDLQCAIITAKEGSETNIRVKEAIHDDWHTGF